MILVENGGDFAAQRPVMINWKKGQKVYRLQQVVGFLKWLRSVHKHKEDLIKFREVDENDEFTLQYKIKQLLEEGHAERFDQYI